MNSNKFPNSHEAGVEAKEVTRRATKLTRLTHRPIKADRMNLKWNEGRWRIGWCSCGGP